jgi:OHCU decarboxylase
MTTRLSLDELNRLDQASWKQALGFVFEHTPSIAERTWSRRPFSSVTGLHAALCEAMYALTTDEQLALIAAHPDLAGRAAIAGELTPESQREQASARLDQLTADEFDRFTQLNSAYRARFGFPFVICVRNHTRNSILQNFEQRLGHDRDQERATALHEIAAIAELRLRDALDDAQGGTPDAA